MKDFVILIVLFSILVEKLSWHRRKVFCSFSVSNGTYIRCFATTKYLVPPYVFRGAWVGLNRKRDFDVLRDKLGMDVAFGKFQIF